MHAYYVQNVAQLRYQKWSLQ